MTTTAIKTYKLSNRVGVLIRITSQNHPSGLNNGLSKIILQSPHFRGKLQLWYLILIKDSDEPCTLSMISIYTTDFYLLSVRHHNYAQRR